MAIAAATFVVAPGLAHAQKPGSSAHRVPQPGVVSGLPTPVPCTPWSVQAGQNPDAQGNNLAAVAALSSRNVWAVGYGILSNGDVNTLVEHFDGAAWSVVPSPNATAYTDQLTAIDAIGPNDIWAVGTSEASSSAPYLTLAEHWNGVSWSVVSTPNLSSAVNGFTLTSVSGDASNDVWAVGNDGLAPIVEHWTGSAWSLVTIAQPDVKDLSMAVTAISPTNAWIVGQYENAQGVGGLLEQWNGASWSVVSPTISGWQSVNLYGVTARSGADIWVVGAGLPGKSANTEPFAMHWNGVAWTVTSTPNGPGVNTLVYSVAEANPNDVWAVGETTYPGPLYRQPFVMQWTPNVGWTVMTTPAINQYTRLVGVSATLPLNVFAVGELVNTQANVLIEEYNPLLSIACH